MATTDGGKAAGIRQEVADLHVVMRLAELVREGRLHAVIDEAIGKYKGNGGCLARLDLAPALLDR